MIGLYEKYEVNKLNGPTDPDADYFVLRLDKDKHARAAARAYAESIKDENPNLAFDIQSRLLKYRGDGRNEDRSIDDSTE